MAGVCPRPQTGGMSYPYQPDPSRDTVAVNDDERTWAVLGHVSTIVAAVLSVGWLSFLGPLLIWAIYKDKSAFVRQSALHSLLQAQRILLSGIPIAVILWIIAFAAGVYCHIRGAILASRGQLYRYPWGIPVLR